MCKKIIPADDVEAHIIMCLTKPKINYNGNTPILTILRNFSTIYFCSEDVLAEDKGECIICLENLEKDQTIARLPCLCIYHKQ